MYLGTFWGRDENVGLSCVRPFVGKLLPNLFIGNLFMTASCVVLPCRVRGPEAAEEIYSFRIGVGYGKMKSKALSLKFNFHQILQDFILRSLWLLAESYFVHVAGSDGSRTPQNVMSLDDQFGG